MEKVCRSCMTVNSEMKNIFDKYRISGGQSLKIAEILMACASVQVVENDGLPAHLCFACEAKLQTAYIFKMQCERSDVTLRTQMHSKVNIKQEPLFIAVPSENEDIYKTYDDNYSNSNYDARDLKIKSKREENEFKCTYCNKMLRTKVNLKIHMRRHTGEKLVNCNICQASFTTKSVLGRHMQVHNISSGGQKHTCLVCGANFAKTGHLTRHKKEHESKTQNIEINEENALVGNMDCFASMETENNNETGNTVITEKITEQEFCDYEFKDITNPIQAGNCISDNDNMPKKHISYENENLSPTEINSCETDNKNENGIIKAKSLEDTITPTTIRKVHKCEDHISKEHVCSICKKSFSSSRTLVRHTKLHLKPDKQYVCPQCGKYFKHSGTLKIHQRIHSKINLCIYCGKQFNNYSNMVVHLRRHTGERPYKCSYCGKGFPRSHDLKCHERIHSGEKPYLCTFCGKSFTKSNKLLRHTRIHTGERPYPCDICGRSFTQSNDLANHKRRHSGSCPYACGSCPERFIRSGQLKNHCRTTGHSAETQQELKGNRRVESVGPETNSNLTIPEIPRKIWQKLTKEEESDVDVKEVQLMENTNSYDDVNHFIPNFDFVSVQANKEIDLSDVEDKGQKVSLAETNNLNDSIKLECSEL